MSKPPTINVEFCLLKGPSPFEKQTQVFSQDIIRIGRRARRGTFPETHVTYPEDCLVVSRDHAVLEREGNRFKLTNHSRFHTYVNGQKVAVEQTQYLNNGDVLEFNKGGPKLSFLVELKPHRRTHDPPPDHEPRFLTIQYGARIERKSLPVTIGSSRTCQFVLDHRAVNDECAEVSFRDNRYWIQNRSGQNLLQVNGKPISDEAVPLSPKDRLAFSPSGPFFCYVEEGRLFEVTE